MRPIPKSPVNAPKFSSFKWVHSIFALTLRTSMGNEQKKCVWANQNSRQKLHFKHLNLLLFTTTG